MRKRSRLHVLTVAALASALGSGLTRAQLPAPGAATPPARTGFALQGPVLATSTTANASDCQAACRRQAGCAGSSFAPRKPPQLEGSRLLGRQGVEPTANCTLVGAPATEVPSPGVVSCRAPCTAPAPTAQEREPSGLGNARALDPKVAGATVLGKVPLLLPANPALSAALKAQADAPPTPPAPATPASTTPLLVGTGISDITGPIAEVGMMGYAKLDQKTGGLHMRLYARAFVFSNPVGGRRVVFVSAELGQLFSSVKQGVLKRLAQRYGNLYHDGNVQLSATHTHAGPGGYSHHAIYNITSLGHVAQNYSAIVDGITEAIVQAHDRVGDASVSIGAADMPWPTSVNRSPQAFARNPQLPGVVPPANTNPEMTVIRIDKGNRPAGAISWFAVHNTSMSNTNKFVSSDHKGWAAQGFEKAYGSVAPLQNYGSFVAAFPNGAEGDLSPNVDGGFGRPGGTEFTATQLIGERESGMAMQIHQGPRRTPVVGDVDFRHMFVRMPGFAVNETVQRNGAGGNTLCSGAFGVSFAAGAEDGPSGVPLVQEGMALSRDAAGPDLARLRQVFLDTVPPPLKALAEVLRNGGSDPCQWPKPVLLSTGAVGWSPEILPFQLLRIGNVVIAGIPGEMTTQAGRTLQSRIHAALQPIGVQRVILTGLANEYSGYITTPDEYDSQQYEGASTLFGRITFEAYLQIFDQLARAMATGQSVPAGPPPPDLSATQLELQTGVVADGVPVGSNFGDVVVQPASKVGVGARAFATFRSSHPKNDLRRNDSYFRIEQNVGGNWVTVAWDSMPETMLEWARGDLDQSYMTVVWDVPRSTAPGTYRIRHFGKAKSLFGLMTPFVGTTRPFLVE